MEPRNPQRRRESDRHHEADAREQIDAIIVVMCDYLGCSRQELLEGLRSMIRKNRRFRKITDGFNIALTGAIVLTLFSAIGGIIAMAVKNFDGF